ncbi:MAG: glycosyl hydrolase family 25 [Ruminococcus flavefaciens]|nr:glycosyl hydrolase family 25 [Ruminococcus flavefaciens]MCM1059513.1 glycosyl hydrolase family 25 [Eubacterium sp.]
MHKLKRIVCILTGGILTGIAGIASCYYSSAMVNSEKYPVFGVDVSNYQGDIDWNILEEQGVRFAFIKATEGSGHVDESVRQNLERASETDIKLSAYHFFSFDSAGETQAENFISVVSADEIDMPPVVDIEYYADKRKNKPSKEEAENILRPLLSGLEEYYGVKPIIYTTLPVYCRYVKENFSDYPLWIRSVNFEPDLINWKFWQYCDGGELEGYNGDEKCIDFNVYNGTEEEFLAEFSSEQEEK